MECPGGRRTTRLRAGRNSGTNERREGEERDRREKGKRQRRGPEELAEEEPAMWQGQVAPRSMGSQRLTHEPPTRNNLGGDLPMGEAGYKEARNGKDLGERPSGVWPERWSEETTRKAPFSEASLREKQTWENGPPSHRNTNKAQRLGKWTGPYLHNDVERIGSTYPETEYMLANRPPDIIWETQPPQKTNYKGSTYKDIMASIGLDSPNTSTDTRGEGAREHDKGASYVNTPIRKSASSLIALSKQIITPRQGRLWGTDNNPS